MSGPHEEAPITARVAERPALAPGKLRDIKPHVLGIRFAAGATTSIAAGLVTLAFGPKVGGVLLAFPAILAASLTLIEEQEDSAEAREDARGAVIGGVALGAFAAVGALTLSHLTGALALLAATLAWFAVAFGGYALAWFRG